MRTALVGVVNESKGTAYRARLDDIEVAGKTGTAQVQSGHAEGGYENGTHAWFVGFAPAGRPKIAIAVLVEHGGHGGDVSAPLAMDIIHNYFETIAPADKDAPHVGRAAAARAAPGGQGVRQAPPSLPARQAPPGAAPPAAPAGGSARSGGDAMNVIKAVGWRKLRFRFDWTLTLSSLTVAGLGLVNLWSAVHERQGNLFTQQISWLGLGAAVFLGVAAFDYRNIARLGYVLHVIGVALLLAVLVGGKMVGGGRRWIDLGPSTCSLRS